MRTRMMIALTGLLCLAGALQAAETLSVRLTPSDAFGPYAAPGSYSRYCLVVWLEDGGGGLARTVSRWAGEKRFDLVTWYAKAGAGNTDAVSGPTIVDPGGDFPARYIWNADLTGLANGTYTVRMELTDYPNATAGTNNLGSFTFQKNGTSSLQTGLSQGGFSGVDLRYSNGTDKGVAQFSVSAFAVKENGGSAVITVRRWGGTAGTLTVDYATADGTAAAGQDYTAASGTISFADGDNAAKSFTVPILADSVSEGDETVHITLTGADAGTPAAADLTIANSAPAGGGGGAPSGGCLPARGALPGLLILGGACMLILVGRR